MVMTTPCISTALIIWTTDLHSVPYICTELGTWRVVDANSKQCLPSCTCILIKSVPGLNKIVEPRLA
jgi:hypothetical protein